MTKVLVITEVDSSDNERIVIGVASSIQSANELIYEHYPSHEVKQVYSDFEGRTEEMRVISVDFVDGKGEYQVWIDWFDINKL